MIYKDLFNNRIYLEQQTIVKKHNNIRYQKKQVTFTLIEIN